jgi:hypothetical protein
MAQIRRTGRRMGSKDAPQSTGDLFLEDTEKQTGTHKNPRAEVPEFRPHKPESTADMFMKRVTEQNNKLPHP